MDLPAAFVEAWRVQACDIACGPTERGRQHGGLRWHRVDYRLMPAVMAAPAPAVMVSATAASHVPVAMAAMRKND